MTVRALCNYNVATIDRNAGVVDAAARMREEHVGDLIVVEERRCSAGVSRMAMMKKPIPAWKPAPTT